MSVKLVAITKPVVEGIDTAEDFVAYAARVSNPANQANTLTTGKLLKYLITNEHWSPLEMVHVVMQIDTTRDIARQILRHRSFSFQEFSQRYADAREMSFTTREARLQDSKNRQNSIENSDEDLESVWQAYQVRVQHESIRAYDWAIRNGIAKEQARAVLPEGMTKSRLYMAGTLRSWLHYCLLRRDNGTQKEHRQHAVDALDILIQQFPSITHITLNEEESIS